MCLKKTWFPHLFIVQTFLIMSCFLLILVMCFYTLLFGYKPVTMYSSKTMTLVCDWMCSLIGLLCRLREDKCPKERPDPFDPEQPPAWNRYFIKSTRWGLLLWKVRTSGLYLRCFCPGWMSIYKWERLMPFFKGSKVNSMKCFLAAWYSPSACSHTKGRSYLDVWMN